MKDLLLNQDIGFAFCVVHWTLSNLQSWVNVNNLSGKEVPIYAVPLIYLGLLLKYALLIHLGIKFGLLNVIIIWIFAVSINTLATMFKAWREGPSSRTSLSWLDPVVNSLILLCAFGAIFPHLDLQLDKTPKQKYVECMVKKMKYQPESMKNVVNSFCKEKTGYGVR